MWVHGDLECLRPEEGGVIHTAHVLGSGCRLANKVFDSLYLWVLAALCLLQLAAPAGLPVSGRMLCKKMH